MLPSVTNFCNEDADAISRVRHRETVARWERMVDGARNLKVSPPKPRQGGYQDPVHELVEDTGLAQVLQPWEEVAEIGAALLLEGMGVEWGSRVPGWLDLWAHRHLDGTCWWLKDPERYIDLNSTTS